MSISNLISSKQLFEALKGDDSGKDAYLQEALHLSDAQFEAIRDIRDASCPLIDKAFDIGEIVTGALISSRIDTTLSSQFTLMTMAGLISSDWDSPKYRIKVASRILNEYYASEIKSCSDLATFKIPGIHFLRDDLGVYDGNVMEVKKELPRVSFSREDLLDSITIPSFSDGLFGLAGVIWGYCKCYPQSSKPGDSLFMYGREHDDEFFAETVEPMFRDVFNKHATVTDYGRSRYPLMIISSRAITTYLKQYLGFHQGRAKFDYIDFDTVCKGCEPSDIQSYKRAFFEGLASTGFYDNDTKTLAIRAPESAGIKVPGFVQDLGFSPQFDPAYMKGNRAQRMPKLIFTAHESDMIRSEYVFNLRLR